MIDARRARSRRSEEAADAGTTRSSPYASDDRHDHREHPRPRVVKTIGQVFGLTVRSRSVGGNITALLKSLAGGEIRSYVKLNEDSRRQALDRMVQNAAAMGANAVTMMRFDSTGMGAGMTEIVAYGTARVIEWAPTTPAP